MGWIAKKDAADEGRFHLKTHLEKLELNGHGRRALDVSAPEIPPASLRLTLAIANLIDQTK